MYRGHTARRWEHAAMYPGQHREEVGARGNVPRPTPRGGGSTRQCAQTNTARRITARRCEHAAMCPGSPPGGGSTRQCAQDHLQEVGARGNVPRPHREELGALGNVPRPHREEVRARGNLPRPTPRGGGSTR
ncbi:hypothetical protein PoB_005615100 [Plakobranchus ocellatus]|uniref:Uncharacterized protein n=1 Tax=Plakobranchus ocellatus TaxID=259542 RepID=A0AAV4CAA5_9GAST|nr:hypothetical protein PoB_005615100 [Plakobranchus ocellatus]